MPSHLRRKSYPTAKTDSPAPVGGSVEVGGICKTCQDCSLFDSLPYATTPKSQPTLSHPGDTMKMEYDALRFCQNILNCRLNRRTRQDKFKLFPDLKQSGSRGKYPLYCKKAATPGADF